MCNCYSLIWVRVFRMPLSPNYNESTSWSQYTIQVVAETKENTQINKTLQQGRIRAAAAAAEEEVPNFYREEKSLLFRTQRTFICSKEEEEFKLPATSSHASMTRGEPTLKPLCDSHSKHSLRFWSRFLQVMLSGHPLHMPCIIKDFSSRVPLKLHASTHQTLNPYLL